MYSKKQIVQIVDKDGNVVDVDSLKKEIDDFDIQIAQIQEFRQSRVDTLNQIEKDVPEIKLQVEAQVDEAIKI